MNRPAKIRNGCDGNMASGTAGSVDRITLARVIKDLPAGYRKIFLLHEIEGYEHPEITKMLDRSVGNSKSQLHKAKLRIRENLGETGTIRSEVPARYFPVRAAQLKPFRVRPTTASAIIVQRMRRAEFG